ncbi:MAG: PQQ-binding-like beta-propeller repeat protein [Candidatus Bathyarchaeota archaeon]|nr:PQQ-binding-like beta-propeller repeat protein [Candidatus Bathyarchaeum tardum]WGM88585.1 MAG: PQQ-binding-like beta-propeller repeat protein [Candidatus Bathyarchaeum tardum]
MKKYTKIQTKLFAFFCVLVFVISTTLAIMPTVVAQDEIREKQTYAIIGATPNPVQVNQQVLLHIGVTDYLRVASDGFEGLTVTVTKPDGTTETLGEYRTDSTGGTGAVYTPTMVGTYTFQTHFPSQTYTWTASPAFSTNIYGTIRYLASDSEILEVEVNNEPTTYYQPSPLPTEYWSRPIDSQLHEWSTISANYVATPPNLVAPYNDDAPETSHILWTNEIQTGGLAGGATWNHAYECGDAYEGFFASSVIIGGKLYYNHYKSGFPTQQVVAVDLHTGEELWVKPLTTPSGVVVRLSFAQSFYWDSYNYHAVFPYLWGTSGSTWHAFDPFDGQYVYSMENVPSGTRVYGPKGEIYIYTVNTANGWMTLWNSSRVVSDEGSWIRFGMGSTFDARDGIEWNVTIPTGLQGSVVAVNFQDRLVGNDAPGFLTMGDLPVHTWAINLEPGHEGELIFNTEWNPPPGDITVSWGTRYNGAPSFEDKVYVLWSKDTRQLYGFDLDTGEQIWGPTEPQHYLDYLGIEVVIAEGIIFSGRMAGIINAYDVKTGQLLWEYSVADPHSEILWSNNWPVRPQFITDGKIYYAHSEHSPVDPKPRGAPFVCLDIETGEEIWRIDGAFRGTDWGGRAIIGDSIIAAMDTYDQRVYAIGKGPSETSVTIENDVIAFGNKALIKGSVMDISPGTQETAIKMRFPKGVPAVSDNSMNDWMLYVYKQFSRPADATGVPVKIEIVDPNNQYAWIGTATTDVYGNYAYSFTPQIEGQYMIIATFDGSASYYASTTTTYLIVDEAPTPSTQIDTEEPIDTQTPPVAIEEPTAFITTEIAIIATVAIAAVIGIGAYWTLKRK